MVYETVQAVLNTNFSWPEAERYVRVPSEEYDHTKLNILTSNGNAFIPSDREHKDQIDMKKIEKFSNLNYQFNYFDYRKSKFIFELARHIYRVSFPETKS